MSVKDISDAMKSGEVYFGLRQTLRNAIKGKNKKSKVFVVSDARETTIKKLQDSGIEFSKIKNVEDSKKELNLDFECEVFLLK